ncbi:uncharacterized protein G2W53_035419 [Senna tora]|uniref:Uncharacterized protein n=1 Tax=Senna tora TaxID=362788 RepID=A0A834SS85_9FABA|nr:uncharacterized protein G2W53_035419 [Senna tora]
MFFVVLFLCLGTEFLCPYSSRFLPLFLFLYHSRLFFPFLPSLHSGCGSGLLKFLHHRRSLTSSQRTPSPPPPLLPSFVTKSSLVLPLLCSADLASRRRLHPSRSLSSSPSSSRS